MIHSQKTMTYISQVVPVLVFLYIKKKESKTDAIIFSKCPLGILLFQLKTETQLEAYD